MLEGVTKASVTPYLTTSKPLVTSSRIGSLDFHGKSGLSLVPNFIAPPVTVGLSLQRDTQREECYGSLDLGSVKAP